ncbi:hypothetical protein LZ30DRAFT_296976 [Colletotrichum cereale]|nr:hypothetical protein LZ30DRAFT_296976 [Colletotrichum cereale]
MRVEREVMCIIPACERGHYHIGLDFCGLDWCVWPPSVKYRLSRTVCRGPSVEADKTRHDSRRSSPRTHCDSSTTNTFGTPQTRRSDVVDDSGLAHTHTHTHTAALANETTKSLLRPRVTRAASPVIPVEVPTLCRGTVEGQVETWRAVNGACLSLERFSL